MVKTKIQVAKKHYFDLRYDSKSRWISYWHQINEVLKLKKSPILEIGIGNKTVSDYLKKIGLAVTTADFDSSLKPDVNADVLDLPFKNNSFGTILCAEVLEHLPFKDFMRALSEIRRVTKHYAVVTIPHDSLTHIYLGIKIIPFVPKIEKMIKINTSKEQHTFDGEHYWEVGKKGYSLEVVKKAITKTGFKIIKDYYPLENPKHHFFILKK